MNINYKNEWNTLKRNLTKGGNPYRVKGCMYMTAKQIENKTATISLVNTIPYDKEIEFHERNIERVATYDSWTDEEKAKSRANDEEYIAKYTQRKAKYGTKENEALERAKAIMETDAWKTFAKNTDIKETAFEIKNDLIYLRINF